MVLHSTHKCLIVLLLTLTEFVFAQNLVQNPGFELNTGLPSGPGQFNLANNWSNAGASWASPDYLHTNGSGNVQLPNSVFGTVNPFQGNAVMHFAMWVSSASNFREYVSQTLAAPLTVGSTYTFSFYITNGIPGAYGGVGIENIHVDFGVNPIVQSVASPLGYTPLLTTGVMTYSNTWIQLSYTFVATAPYTNFVIGNFYDDANTITQQFDLASTPGATYFIDEVSLTLTVPTFNVTGDNQICIGDSSLLQAFNSSTYAWADSLNPNIILNVDSTLMVNPLVTTTYFVYGDSDTLSFTVNVFNPTQFSLGNDTTLCEGEILILDPQISNGTFLWQDNSNNPTFTVSQAGSYWLNLTVNSCGSTDTINVAYNTIPAFDLGNDTTLCTGETLVLDAQTSNATYVWNNNSANATLTVSEPGVYWVIVTVNSCSTSDTLILNYNTQAVFDLGNDTSLCPGESLLLNAQTSNANYIWHDNSENATFNVSQQGIYWVNVTVNNCSLIDSIEVNYNPIPSINLGVDTSLCFGETLMLNAQVAGASYLWQDNSTNQTYNVSEPGIYWVIVTNNNCIGADTIQIGASDCEIILEMPNVLTPNNDGVNDRFFPSKYKGINEGTLGIYNRWGQKMVETTNLTSGWDGKSDGNDCMAGTYFWIINYTTIDNEAKTLTGFLTLLR